MKIGTTEFIVILIVALLALGPEKMPLYAKKLGKAISMIKEYSGKITEEIKENITDPLADAVEPVTSLKKEFRDAVSLTAAEANKPAEGEYAGQ